MNHRTEINNALILDALATGRLRTDAETGQVWLDGELQTRRLNGYISVSMDGHFFGAHRAVWLYQINHRNRTTPWPRRGPPGSAASSR